MAAAHRMSVLITGLALTLGVLAVPSFAADAPARITEVEARKAVVGKVNPLVPPIAKQMHLTGRVRIEIIIDDQGKVESAKVLSGNPVLAKACTDAMKNWLFTPFEGKKVTTEMTFEMN